MYDGLSVEGLGCVCGYLRLASWLGASNGLVR